MLKFIGSVFRKFWEIWLWIVQIVLPIGGAIAGGNIIGAGGAVGFFFLGALAGFLINVFFGGLIVTFLNIGENLERLAKGGNLPGTGKTA
jgi:uncharacterized membrane protein